MPLVFSYHTDLQVYADRYVPWPVLNQLARGLTAVPFYGFFAASLSQSDYQLKPSPMPPPQQM